MAHKYIKEIVDLKETPYGYCEGETPERDSKWREQRRIYGFDSRETWNLDYTFFCWLYERLAMFKEVNCIDLNFHEFNINGKTLTQGECIDKMLENCKTIIIDKDIENEDLFKLKTEVLDIWKECIFYMWW